VTIAQIHPMQFYSKLRWIDGRPLLDVIEPYRRELLTKALFSFDDRGRLLYGTVIAGRARKNWKSADLTLAALYKWLVWDSDGPRRTPTSCPTISSRARAYKKLRRR
jgi:hypothetical protein